MPLTPTLTLARPGGPWPVAFPAQKLLARGALPGAFGYDLAAQSFRLSAARGLSPAELLPAALPCSWMVNARATSPVFRRWLEPPLRGAWEALLALTAGGPDAWLARTPEERERVLESVRALCVEGQGVAAVSKALALLCPESVPLMDDAALWFALDALPRPSSADTPSAGPEWFLPMMDWFSRAQLEARDALVGLARGYTLATLDAAQVLDRVLWFESWGHRIARGRDAVRWWWVADGAREAIVPVGVVLPGRTPDERVALEDTAEPFRGAARAALGAGLGG